MQLGLLCPHGRSLRRQNSASLLINCDASKSLISQVFPEKSDELNFTNFFEEIDSYFVIVTEQKLIKVKTRFKS